MCEIRAAKEEFSLTDDGRSPAIWPYITEAIAYQVLCVTGFVVNVLAFLVLSLPRPSVQLHPSSIPSTSSTLYRLVSLILLLILPLFAVRNFLQNFENVYSFQLSSNLESSCVPHEVSNLLSELQVPLENLLLSLFVLLVGDRYVALYKPFGRLALFRRHCSVYSAVALIASGLLLLSAYPIYSHVSILVQTTSADTFIFQLETQTFGKSNFTTVTNIPITTPSETTRINKRLNANVLLRIFYNLFLLLQVLFSIAVVILPFAM